MNVSPAEVSEKCGDSFDDLIILKLKRTDQFVHLIQSLGIGSGQDMGVISSAVSQMKLQTIEEQEHESTLQEQDQGSPAPSSSHPTLPMTPLCPHPHHRETSLHTTAQQDEKVSRSSQPKERTIGSLSLFKDRLFPNVTRPPTGDRSSSFPHRWIDNVSVLLHPSVQIINLFIAH
jgi:hypothetical protein